MTSRHIRRNAQGELHSLSNEELARLERHNRQQPRPANTTMGDHNNQDDLAAAMTLMQQLLQKMKQAMQTQQEQQQQNQQEHQVQGPPIGQRNLPRNFPTTRSAINPPSCTRQDFETKPALINLVQKKIFNGLAAEIPMDPIESFERVCNSLARIEYDQITSSVHCSLFLLMEKQNGGQTLLLPDLLLHGAVPFSVPQPLLHKV